MVLAGVGVVGGFVWQKRRRRRAGGTLGGQGDGDELHGAAAVVLAGSRRAFITSLILLRSSTALAFRRTAKHYAPVPLTFTAAVLSALPSIFGTAFSINLVVVNGVSMAGLFLRRQAPGSSNVLSASTGSPFSSHCDPTYWRLVRAHPPPPCCDGLPVPYCTPLYLLPLCPFRSSPYPLPS